MKRKRISGEEVRRDIDRAARVRRRIPLPDARQETIVVGGRQVLITDRTAPGTWPLKVHRVTDCAWRIP